MGAEEGRGIEAFVQQFAEAAHEHLLGIEGELAQLDVGVLLHHLAQPVEALDATAVIGRALHIGDATMAEPDQIIGDGGARLVVGAVHHVEALERVDPAIERQRNTQFLDPVLALLEVRPHHRHAGAGAGKGLHLVWQVCPDHASLVAAAGGLALEA